jgi:hypothetical protein
MFNLDESTVDFMIYLYRLGGKIKFLWKLCDHPFRNFKDYPPHLFCAEVQLDYLKMVINEFKNIVDAIKGSAIG